MFYYIYKLKEDETHKNSNNDFYKLKGQVVQLTAVYADGTEDKFLLNELDYNKVDERIEDYRFENQEEIDGIVNLGELEEGIKVPFRLRLGSKFIFIQTDFQSQKFEAIRALEVFLYSTYKVKLENFAPKYEKEFDLICNFSKAQSAKFYSDNDIITDDEMEEEICEIYKKKDFTLFEAFLEFNITDNDIIYVYYYGDALYFTGNVNPEDIETFIQTFENVMS